jgi:hypothetical protein
MGHQPRLGHDRPYKVVGMICWRVISSVLGEELGSPRFRGLVAPSFSFLMRPTSLKISPRTPNIVKYLRRSRNATSVGRFRKSLKRLSRCIKGEHWVLSLWEHVILYLSFRKKRAMFEMEICNDNYGWTKNDDINGWNEKNIKYKEMNNWKKDLYWMLIWLLWNVSLNEDNFWDMPVISGGTKGEVL